MLIATRTYAACLRDGFAFTASHLWLITRAQWWRYAVAAVLLTLLLAAYTWLNVCSQIGEPLPVEALIAAPLLLTAWLATAWEGRRHFVKLFRQTQDEDFRLTFKQRLRKPAKQLGTFLLAAFIAIIACLVPLLPVVITTQAYFASIEAHYNFGDPAVIPATGYAAMVALCTVCLMLCALILTTVTATMQYVYADIKARQQ